MVHIEECSPLITYKPAEFWEGAGNQSVEWYSGGGYISSWHPGADASFSFDGTSFSIFGLKSNSSGNFTVSIDGAPQTGTAYIEDQPQYNATLFEINDLTSSMHNIVFTIEGYKPVHIDYVTWHDSDSSRKSDGDPDDDDEPNMELFQDSNHVFEYSPQNAWNTDPNNVNQFLGQSGHSTSMSDASLTLNFTGRAISLYGAVGPSQSSSYWVSLDGGSPTHFNASKSWWSCKQVLYHASNLEPGEHRLVVTNGPTPNTNERRQTTDVGSFDFDHAKVWGLVATTLASSPTPTPTPAPTSPTIPTSNSQRLLSPGVIAGIVVASLVFVVLLAAIWFLCRRNKTLWMRLQKGYMVQSQFDTSSPRPNMSNVLPTVNRPLPHGGIEPYPPGYEATSHSREGGSKDGLYVPYSGFGRQRSTSKSSSQTYTTEPSKEGYQAYATHVDEPTRNEPSRSGTILTASTLVAEAGTDGTVDEEAQGFPRKPQRWNTLRRVGTPTNSSVPSLAPIPVIDLEKAGVQRVSTKSSTRSSRRRTKDYRNSHSSRRSSSPSQVQLLGGNAFQVVEEEEHGISDEDADFYASQATASYETPLSPSRSLAITQSEIQTPVANRMFDFQDEDIPPVPLARNDSAVVASGDRVNYQPYHQSSSDTFSTLPAYSSKRASLS